jgi:N utilization substance protein B
MSAPTGKRRKSRELAMQMLFQADVGKQTPDQVRRTFWEAREEVDADTRGFAEDLYRVANVREEEVTELMDRHSAHWRLERMPAVDRNVLRMAIAEMIGFPSTPAPIVINEALEIARRYSAPESINFLNGVLDAVAKSRRGDWQPAEGRR